MERRLDIDISRQPDDTTCGPTCLQAVYKYYGLDLPLDRVIHEVKSLKGGGTLAVLLGCHALRQGFKATIYTYNLHVFDPTWFVYKQDIAKKLRAQAEARMDAKLSFATNGYLDFLENGGKLKFKDLNGALIRHFLNKSVPILTGLSATYLYHTVRERPVTGEEDDIAGLATGHFVVLYGYERTSRMVMVADPYGDNPVSLQRYYPVSMDRLICSILLGILTYDANLLIIEPKHRRGK